MFKASIVSPEGISCSISSVAFGERLTMLCTAFNNFSSALFMVNVISNSFQII
ncbi:hypothetical protein CCOA0049 [Campylobacter coli RM2228]|nr:hypothetical protein CCOA0049 [Campylobacter coli RM2228]